MASWMLVCFLHVLRLALISSESATVSPDPCVSSSELEFLRQREVGYQLAEDESPICDQYFIDGWYEMFDYVIASTEEGCGTHYNWYRKDELPDDHNVHNVTFCLNIGDGNCGLTNKGFVKKCSEDKYVFYLHSLPGCSQAYCIEKLNGTDGPDDTPPDISAIKPKISINLERINEKNELHFFCNFTPPTDTDYFYVTEWGIHSGFSWTDLLLSTQPKRYENHIDFMKYTSLTEPILRQKGFARLGIRIACLTKAMNSPTGALSDSRESDSKFCGIEVLNKKVSLNSEESTTVSLQLTVPFGCDSWATIGCALDVTMFIPQNSDKCRVPDLSQTDQPDRVNNRCGVSFMNDEVMVPKTIRITSLDGHNVEFRRWKYTLVLATQKTFLPHPLFQNYSPDTIEVEVSTNMTKINGKWCHSQNDPHMATFDGLYYENQNPGTFLLYRNKIHNVQVQMKTTRCHESKNIWCNCGVAVNAGRDVFIIDQCPGQNPHWHPMFRCDDHILARSVKRDLSGKNYIVYLPTGTQVHISLSTRLLNIYIKASLADWHNTDGLCGTFNENPHDDRFKRPGSTQEDINMSWELTEKRENLFEPQNDDVLNKWVMEKLLCHCPHDFGVSQPPESYIECEADKSKKCTEDKSDIAFEERCSLARKKRNVHGIHVNKEIDLHINTNTKFVSKQAIFRKHISKRTVYDYASAKIDCQKILNTTAFQMCSEVPVLNVDSFVEECILDAIATNSMDWTMDHLESLKSQCVYEVKINQPLSAEDLAGTNSSQSEDSTGHLNNTETPAFTQDFLTRLEDVVCLNECSGKGRCNNSDCICDAGFIGADCSVDASEPPVMSGIPDDGECDLQLRECAKTSVFGMNFVSSPNLTCNIVPFRVSPNKEIQTNDSFRTKGKLETFVEVSCTLTTERKKRSTDSISDDYVAEGYRVSVSNDGVIFSEEDTLVIFDSECVDCKKVNGQIICTQKPGFCVKGGQCYKYGEKHGCYSCEGHNNVLEWTPGPDCPIKIPPTNTERSLWIIPVVVCPVIVILIIGILICYLHGKKTLVKTHSADVFYDAKKDKLGKTNISI